MSIPRPLRLVLIFFATASLLLAQSQQEMNQQAEAEAAAADKQLNGVYQKLLTRLDDGEAKSLLKAAQRAWLVYRDAEASYSADEMRGGSGARLLYAATLSRLTKERTKVLREELAAYQ